MVAEQEILKNLWKIVEKVDWIFYYAKEPDSENIFQNELDVEKDVINIVEKTKNLVVCSYPTKDLDRLLSFYNAADSQEEIWLLT